MINRSSLAVVIGAVITFLAQIIIAPNIAIYSAMPNFFLAFVLVLSIMRPPMNSTLVIAFVMGLFFDLLGHGPVGAMALLLLVIAFATSRLFAALDNDSLFIPISIMVTSVLLVELFYGVFMLVFTNEQSIFEIFIRTALPCALYDCVACLIAYPLASRFITHESTPTMHDAKSATLQVGPKPAAEHKVRIKQTKPRRR